MGRTIRLFILTANDLYRNGLVSLLHQRDGTVQVVGAYRELNEPAMSTACPDIVLLDDALAHGKHIFELLADYRRRYAPLSIAILSDRLNSRYMQRLFRAGASGFIYKEDRLEGSLASGINVIGQGYFYSSPKANSLLLTSPTDPAHLNLNQTDRDVLTLIDKGLTMKEITTVLQLTLGSVYRIRNKLCDVLDAPTHQHLIAAARENGLLDDASSTF